MKRLVSYFFEGLLFLVPIVLTVYIFYIVFIKIDNLIKVPLPGLGIIPGIGFLTTLLLVITIGFLVSNFLTRGIFKYFDRFLNRLPLVKLLYGSVKDMLNAFVGEKKSFDKPVMVRLSAESHAHVLGFVTSDSLELLGLPDYVSVYIPQSYNFAGQLLVFPGDQVRPLCISSAEMMTFIVSGGVSSSSAKSSVRS